MTALLVSHLGERGVWARPHAPVAAACSRFIPKNQRGPATTDEPH